MLSPSQEDSPVRLRRTHAHGSRACSLKYDLKYWEKYLDNMEVEPRNERNVAKVARQMYRVISDEIVAKSFLAKVLAYFEVSGVAFKLNNASKYAHDCVIAALNDICDPMCPQIRRRGSPWIRNVVMVLNKKYSDEEIEEIAQENEWVRDKDEKESIEDKGK